MQPLRAAFLRWIKPALRYRVRIGIVEKLSQTPMNIPLAPFAASAPFATSTASIRLLCTGWSKPALLAAVAVVPAALLAGYALLGRPVETLQAVRSDLVQTVVASGRVMTPQRAAIGVEVTGRVAQVPVREGQSVTRGQSLIVLEDQDERAALAQAAASVAQAEARVRQVREVGLPVAEQSVLQSEANVRQLRRVMQRNQELHAKGFIGQAALDDAQRNLDVAESQWRAAQVQAQSSRPAGSDAALARTALEQARASHALAVARLAQHTARAPADGVLIGRNVEPGAIVQPGKDLMLLAPAGETELVVQIDEKNLAKLALGQKAQASADAYPAGRFDAQVSYINPGVDAARGAVEVKLKVASPPAYLRQDMTVSVEIEVARRTGVVVIPAEAVRDGAGAQPWVLAVRDGHAVRVPLKLGLRGDARIEVLDGVPGGTPGGTPGGVTEGERLVPPSNGLVKAGQRVRTATAP